MLWDWFMIIITRDSTTIANLILSNTINQACVCKPLALSQIHPLNASIPSCMHAQIAVSRLESPLLIARGFYVIRN